MAGHGERMPDIRGMYTETLVVAHRKGIPVRQFGEIEGGQSPINKRDTHSDAGVSFVSLRPVPPNCRTAAPIPDLSAAGHGERVPDIRGTFTTILVVAHRKVIPVRLFGEMEAGAPTSGCPRGRRRGCWGSGGNRSGWRNPRTSRRPGHHRPRPPGARAAGGCGSH